MPEWFRDGYPLASRATSGIATGLVGAFASQGFHNAALTAGGMIQMGETPSTLSCLKRVYSNFGLFFIVKGVEQRMGIICIASGALTVADMLN